MSVPSVFGTALFAFHPHRLVHVSHGMWISPDQWIVMDHGSGHHEIWHDALFRKRFRIVSAWDDGFRVERVDSGLPQGWV